MCKSAHKAFESYVKIINRTKTPIISGFPQNATKIWNHVVNQRKTQMKKFRKCKAWWYMDRQNVLPTFLFATLAQKTTYTLGSTLLFVDEGEKVLLTSKPLSLPAEFQLSTLTSVFNNTVWGLQNRKFTLKKVILFSCHILRDSKRAH